jgi:hypothetical protein
MTATVQTQRSTAYRRWLTPQDYNEAVQNPALNFADAELRGGTPELTPLGLPRAISGGFASVYRLRCGRRDWAVRCFLREVPDQQERYAAIGRHLATAKLPYTVGFAFLADGIRVGGRAYPLLKMEWVQGESLDRWIERHLGDAAALRGMADRWVALLRALRRASVAHGDLQHGNILVVNDELRLIDYDGVFVPALAGRGATEVGHRNYQHPRRGPADYGPHLDHFAAWSIYISLRALAIEPGLWSRLGGGDEALLLRREDYERPATSAAFAALEALPDPAFMSLVGRFRAMPGQAVADLPPLDGTDQSRRAPRGATPVRAARGATVAPASGAAAWLADHLPAPPRRRFEMSLLPDRVGVGVSLAVVVVLAVLAVAGVVALATAATGIMFGAVVVALTLLGRFVVLPSSPALIAARLRVGWARLCVGWWARVAGWLALWSERVDAREATRLAALAEERQGRMRDERAARGAVRRSLEHFDAERRQLAAEEDEEVARALRFQQHRAVAAQLGGFALLDAELPGFGPQALLHLLKAGIRTAADIVDVRVSRQGRSGGDVVEVEVPGRGLVTVDGIGRKRAQALLAWRQDLVARTGVALPAALPVADEAAIRLRYHSRRQAIERKEATAARRAARQEAAIRERARDERAELALRADEVRERAALARHRCAALQRAAQARLDAYQLALAIARRDTAAYRAVGFGAYLRAIVGLREGR